METRSHETSIEIEAPLEEVWKAITEAEEIQKWFAPKVTVKPGVGGSMTGSWGPGMEGTQQIEVWEPNRHLRLIDEREQSVRLVVDYFLESAQGKTVLRLVHSGFGASAEWDGEYSGTQSGWAGFFRVLKYTIEKQRGKAVRNLNLFHTVPRGDAPGLLGKLKGKFDLKGTAWVDTPGLYQGVVDSLDGALVTIMASGKAEASQFYVNMTLYDFGDERAAKLEGDWKKELEALA